MEKSKQIHKFQLNEQLTIFLPYSLNRNECSKIGIASNFARTIYCPTTIPTRVIIKGIILTPQGRITYDIAYMENENLTYSIGNIPEEKLEELIVKI